MMRRSIVITVGMIASCLQPLVGQTDPVGILARAGSDVITEAEFLQRYELVPRRMSGGHSGQLRAKEELLLSLVAEKLLAQGARDIGLDRDMLFRSEMDNVRRLLGRDELYREQVQRKVTVSQAEIQENIPLARRSLLVEYVFARDAAILTAMLPIAWETLPSLAVPDTDDRPLVHDTVTVNWGDAESVLEESVFSLSEGEVTPIVKGSMGWFVARVLRSFTNPDAQALGPAELHDRIAETIRIRKEKARLDTYIAEILQSADSYAKPEPFRRLTESIREVNDQGGQSATDPQLRVLLLGTLGGHAEDTLLVMNQTIMTIGQAVDKLLTTGMTFEDDSYLTLEQRIHVNLRTWAWQSILEDMALDLSLDARSSVQTQLRMWESHYLSEAYRRRSFSEARSSPLDAYRMLILSGTIEKGPSVDVEIAFSGSVGDLTSYIIIGDSVSTGDNDRTPANVHAVKMYDIDILSLGALGDSMWTLEDRVWCAPQATDSGFTAARMLRRSQPNISETTDPDSLSSVARGMRAKQRVSRTIADLAARKGYAIFEDRLQQLQVSGTPMMSFRQLGFGGRMFAVPFVRPQYDWIEILDREGRILP